MLSGVITADVQTSPNPALFSLTTNISTADGVDTGQDGL